MYKGFELFSSRHPQIQQMRESTENGLFSDSAWDINRNILQLIGNSAAKNVMSTANIGRQLRASDFIQENAD